MRSSRQFRVAAFATWFLLVVGVLVAFVRQDPSLVLDSGRVATLEHRSGAVQVRREGLVHWHDALGKQSLVDGDRVATGRGAAATVIFGPGRTIVLREETLVQIIAIATPSQDAAYMIRVVRGGIVAGIEGTCLDCPPLVIRAGDDTYNVSTGNRIGVFKALDKKAQKVNASGPWPEASSDRGPLLSADFLKDPNVPPPVKLGPKAAALAAQRARLHALALPLPLSVQGQAAAKFVGPKPVPKK